MPFACYSGATEELETDANKLGSRWRYAEPFFDQKGTICLDSSVKSVFLGPTAHVAGTEYCMVRDDHQGGIELGEGGKRE